MNLNEYKIKRLKELKYFFRGIAFDNVAIKNKKIINGLTPECSDFFNGDENIRKVTEKLLLKIKGMYNELVFTYLENAGTKEEIDLEIKKFMDDMRREVDYYKFDVIKISFQPENEEKDAIVDEMHEVPEKNMINMGLNFIKYKLGDMFYQMPKIGREAELEEATVDNLNDVLIYIYVIKCMIEDKKNKQEEFIDFIATNYDVKDEEYIKVRKLQGLFLNEKNYDTFIKKYNGVVEEVVTMVIDRKQENKKANIK